MTINKKTILLVCRKAPYGNSLAKEALDIALAGAAFEQQLQVLFTGDGVLQLLNQQNTQPIGTKNISKHLAAFPLYDLNDIYVDQQSLQQRGLETSDLLSNVRFCDTQELTQIMDEADVVFNF